MNARRTSLFLYLIARVRPEAWDAIIPHGPKVSAASREYLIAMALKGFGAELANKPASQKLGAIEKTLVAFAGQQLSASFDDDDWCGTPYPGKFHGPGVLGLLDEVSLNPQPLPPKEQEREIGGYLVMLSEATRQASAAKDLLALGNSLMGTAARGAGQAV
ncbi:MAG TPA: hypothetical protein VG297_19160 [Bryobacteraceae bacterium]|jgi:hypothetical protein|nr:hypothetical protein [Bryobacteraceae bacterium]